MLNAVRQCPFHEQPLSEKVAGQAYTMNGGPKGWPCVGMLKDAIVNPMGLLLDNAQRYGDIIPNPMIGTTMLQVNHPDLVQYVLVENHKNYQKSIHYRRFESAVGQGLLISNGEKWRRDRQKIQPMFRRDQIEGYYFDVVNEVTEKFKQKWLSLTEKGPVQINLAYEMAAITTEIILRIIFGKDNLTEKDIVSLHHSFDVLMSYLKTLRVFPDKDMRKFFHMPSYYRFRKEVANIEVILSDLTNKYRKSDIADKLNLLALLIEAQKVDPANFNDRDIRDHSIMMVFAGFETTSIVMQWLWFALDSNPEVRKKLRDEMIFCAPCTANADSSGLRYEQAQQMEYTLAAIRETMRLYPPFWLISRSPVEDDCLGGYKVKAGTEVVLPQIVIHRSPRWWDNPNAFIPDRFLPENEHMILPGAYFPFALGARGCVGAKLGEMEARVIATKLLPMFRMKMLNAVDNGYNPSISLKFKKPLIVEIDRL